MNKKQTNYSYESILLINQLERLTSYCFETIPKKEVKLLKKNKMSTNIYNTNVEKPKERY